MNLHEGQVSAGGKERNHSLQSQVRYTPSAAFLKNVKTTTFSQDFFLRILDNFLFNFKFWFKNGP